MGSGGMTPAVIRPAAASGNSATIRAAWSASASARFTPGGDTRDVAVGQLVLLPGGRGSWSTHVVIEAAQLTPLPSEADPLQLSMMTINPPTAALLPRSLASAQRPGASWVRGGWG